MTCSRRFGRLLQGSSLGLISMLTIVGCGGSESGPRRDTGVDSPVQQPDGGPKLGTATASPALIDFGTVDVGTPSTPQTVTVTVANGPVAISPTITGAGFTISSNTCQPTQQIGSCTIGVKFTPTTTGGASGSLSLGAATTASVSLNGTGNTPGTFSVTPDSVALGPVAVNQATTATITITPQPSIPTISCTPTGADLTAGGTTCSSTGPVTQACTYTFTFKATTAGTKSDTITCTGGGKTTSTQVTATAVTPAQLAIQPSPAAFAATVNTVDTVTLTVVNNGGSATGVLAPTITPAGTPFSVATSDCVALASLAVCHVQVSFSPKTAGNSTGTLTLSDGTVQGTATLNGTAVAASNVAIAPNPSDFGSVVVGASSAATTFTMTNSGGTPTAVLTVSSASTEFVVGNDLCSGNALAASASCTFAVTFTPSSAGSKSANITALQAGGAAAAVAKVTGTATAPQAALLSMAPATLDFGTIGVGTTSAPKVFTVTNSGTGPSGTLSIVKKDSTSSTGGAAQFSYTTTCSAALAANASCQVVVTYAPTLQGNASATITVTDGTVSTPTTAGTVVGSALNGIVPTVSCGTAPIFPDTIVGTTANATCTVTNPATTGSQSTGAITVAVTGDYSVPTAGNTCTASLAPQGTCTFTLTFAPTTKGARTGVLTVSTASGGITNQSISANGLLELELQELTGANCAIVAGVPTNCTAVTTEPYDFTQVSVGSSSPVLTVAAYVRAAAVGSLTVATDQGFATPANFVITGGTCPTSGTTPITAANVSTTNVYCYYTLKFTPQSKTTVTGTLTLTGADNSTDKATVTGTGTGPLTISPAPVAFSTVATGSNATMTVTLSNNSSTLDVSALHVGLTAGTGTGATEFVISNDGITGQTITHGTTRTLTVTFAPTSAGAKAATLTITGTDTAGNEGATAAITGTAGTPAGLTAAITTAIPTTALNGVGMFTVTVTNGGGAASGNIVAAVSSAEFTLTPPTGQSRGTCGNTSTGDTPLTAGATCTINAWFTPTSASGLGVGARTGTLTVSASPGGVAQVALSATPTPELTISPAAIQDFGNALLSTPSATTVTFTVTNNSAATAHPSVASVANVNSLTPSVPADFIISNNTCTGNLQGLGGTCTFVVQMTPSTRGIRYATLVVTDGLTAQTASVDVKGTGQNPANLEFTTATGRDWNFGQVPLNTVSAPVTYTLTNTGDVASGPLAWVLNDVGGANAGKAHQKTADFTWTSATNCPQDVGLAPSASCNLVLTFNPTSCSGTSCTTTTTVDVNLVVTANPGAPTTPPGVPANSGSAALPEIKGSTTAGAGAATLVENSTGKSPYTFPAIGTAASLNATFTFSTTAGATITGITFADANPLPNGVVTSGCPGPGCEFTETDTCGAAVSPNGSCSVNVVWTPTTLPAGTREVVVSVGGTTASAVLVATKPAPVSLAVSPASPYAFGTLIQGQAAATTFTVTNNGGVATSGNLVASATAGKTSDVAIAATGCNAGAPLAAGGSCVLSLTVTPATAETGAQTATVTVVVAGTGGAINVPIVLNWTAVATAQLSLSPSPIDFTGTAISVGAASTVATITITAGTSSIISGPLSISVDDADFTVAAVNPAGAGAIDCSNFTAGLGVNAGGTAVGPCQVYVTFKPTALTPTSKQGNLKVTSTSGASATAVLLGTAKAALSVSPATQAFPTTVANSPVAGPPPHTTQVFTFTNNGLPTTGVLTATVSGTNAAEFVITADTCTSQTLASGATCTVTVRFDPTSAGASKSATLTVSGTPGDSAAAALTGVATST